MTKSLTWLMAGAALTLAANPALLRIRPGRRTATRPTAEPSAARFGSTGWKDPTG